WGLPSRARGLRPPGDWALRPRPQRRSHLRAGPLREQRSSMVRAAAIAPWLMMRLPCPAPSREAETSAGPAIGSCPPYRSTQQFAGFSECVARQSLHGGRLGVEPEVHLKPEPELRGHAEVSGQTQRHVRCESTLTQDNFVDSTRKNPSSCARRFW